MKIELRNVKYAAFASEETSCFSATIYIDGVKAGEVANDGHGGSNRYHPWALADRIGDYAKTLPEEEHFGMMLQPDADCVVGDALTAFLRLKDLRRVLKSRIAFVRNGKIYTSKTTTPAVLANALADPAKIRAIFKTDTILNLLPEADALAAYIAGTEG